MLAEVTSKYVNEHNIVERMEKVNEQLLKQVANLGKQSLGEPPRRPGIPVIKPANPKTGNLNNLKQEHRKHYILYSYLVWSWDG